MIPCTHKHKGCVQSPLCRRILDAYWHPGLPKRGDLVNRKGVKNGNYKCGVIQDLILL